MNSFGVWFSGPSGQQNCASAASCTAGHFSVLKLQKTSAVLGFCPAAFRPTTTSLNHMVAVCCVVQASRRTV